jgi:hypothetical protein
MIKPLITDWISRYINGIFDLVMHVSNQENNDFGLAVSLYILRGSTEEQKTNGHSAQIRTGLPIWLSLYY